MPNRKRRFVLCVDSGTYEHTLEPRKVYQLLEDPVAQARSLLRVVDDSGEDYLFPARLFVPIRMPEKAEPVFAIEASAAR